MQGDTIVFFPKYTTLSGAIDSTLFYYSDPYDVTRFNQIDIEVFVLAINGTGQTVTLTLQESNDLETWTTVGTPTTVTTSATSPVSVSASNTSRYIRYVVGAFGGADNVVTFWVKGVARNT